MYLLSTLFLKKYNQNIDLNHLQQQDQYNDINICIETKPLNPPN